jgi:hypothetical protein
MSKRAAAAAKSNRAPKKAKPAVAAVVAASSAAEKSSAQDVFVLTIAKLWDEDGYRGELDPRVFSSREKAERALIEYLRDYLYEEVNSGDDAPLSGRGDSHWEHSAGLWELKADYCNSFAEIQVEIFPYVNGPELPSLTWDITEVRLDA